MNITQGYEPCIVGLNPTGSTKVGCFERLENERQIHLGRFESYTHLK